MCSPVREGQSTTLSCNVNTAGCSSGTVLTWYVGSREAARCTNSQGCFGIDNSISATLSSAGRSTLTVNSVSRTDPFDMEAKWACRPCVGSRITACEKLEIFCEFTKCKPFSALFIMIYFFIFVSTYLYFTSVDNILNVTSKTL